ncbi:uncharacterized protein SAPINGB_P005789 [Magnusiomyces paraingens]|uniref:Thioredoxin domain-containing protein n=1 Tax=Magnusiomyces paraingens TaxID=2606893 RepID=A0A5E8C8K8_9ASCO|nr:uncharacterized protein SAPINGB_P005789 [Saprochaete ingens]VVT57626.1 unnamed protein product [Saprochaete ingens]
MAYVIRPFLTFVLLTTLVAIAQASLPGFYEYPSSPVIEVDANNFRSIVFDTQHLTLVEFYAPWCGHCKELKSEYIKTAKSLKGVANVAAINCNEDRNRVICNQFRVKGYPTLKLFGPKGEGKIGSDFLKDYLGARKSVPIRKEVMENIRGYTKTISSAPQFIKKYEESPRVLLISGKTHLSKSSPSLFKSLSIDFHPLGDPEGPVFGFVPYKHAKQTLKDINFDTSDFNPSLSVLAFYPKGNDSSPIFYTGSMRRENIADFLSEHLEQFDALDPAKRPKKKLKAFKKRQVKVPKKDKRSTPKTSSKWNYAEAEATGFEGPLKPTESNQHRLFANRLFTGADLRKRCFQTTSKPCVVAAIGVNMQMDGLKMFSSVETRFEPTEKMPRGLTSVNWMHMIDTTEDENDEVAGMVNAFGLKPYYPDPWPTQDLEQQIKNLQRAGLSNMKPSANWDHPPNVVYINAKEGYYINFHKKTELTPSNIADFVIRCNKGHFKERRKNLPKGYFVSPVNDEL